MNDRHPDQGPRDCVPERPHGDPLHTDAWLSVRESRQRVLHLVPIADGFAHEVFDRTVEPAVLHDDSSEPCACGPCVPHLDNGYVVILHHALDGRPWPPATGP